MNWWHLGELAFAVLASGYLSYQVGHGRGHAQGMREGRRQGREYGRKEGYRRGLTERRDFAIWEDEI